MGSRRVRQFGHGSSAIEQAVLHGYNPLREKTELAGAVGADD